MQPQAAEYDELVMTLVESALRKAPSERETFLRSACGNNSSLYEDVMSRVTSEERMAGFLDQPVFAQPRPDPANEAPFEIGELVSNRFRILRRIGHGGMGVVYEALDEKLDRRIAIKGARVGFRNRLPPEARAASEVSHYNICKVHELHTAGDVEFLTMEFVDGETLAHRLRGLEPLTEAEARDIIRQIAAGLAQAHRQGVVHGDLKPGNVLLARQPDGSTRAVITDFGLAKLLSTSTGLATSDRGGTLDYMAPELLRGGRATIASDIYAFGVMIREIIAPAVSKTKKTTEPTPSQSTLTLTRAEAARLERTKQIDLPAPWSAVVRRATAPEPASRYSRADEVAADLQPRSTWLRWTIAATLAAVLAAAGFLYRTATRPAPVARLAVLLSIEGAPNTPALAGLGVDLANRLSRASGLTVISAADTRQYNVRAPEQAASTLGATHVLTTRITAKGPDLIAYASLVHAPTGRVIRELSGSYSPSDTAGLAKAILGIVTGGLNLPALTTESVNAAAHSDYIQGMALLNRDNDSAALAIPYLERAAVADPKSALPYAALAESHRRIYARTNDKAERQAAEALTVKAKAINPDAPEVLLIDGLLKSDSNRYAQAAEAYTRATQIAPGNPDAWRRLALAYGRLGRPEDALATYRKAAETQPTYFRLYLDWFNFHWGRSEYTEAEAVIRRLTAVAPGLYAGHTNLAAVLLDQGRFAEAEAEARESLRIRETPVATYLLASGYYYQRRFTEAIPLFTRAMQMARPDTADWFALGDAHHFAGHPAEAKAAWTSGLKLAEQLVMAHPQDGTYRSSLALFAAKLGDRARAQYEIAQAVQMAPDDGKVRRRAAETYQVLADLPAAVNILREAKPALLAELSRSPNFEALAADPAFQQLMQPKGR